MIGQVKSAVGGAIGGSKNGGGEAKQAGGPLGKLNQIINSLKGPLTNA